MSLPKMHWLPKDEWRAPRVGAGSGELSGEAPLAGLFSGFWASPCLLPTTFGSDPVSMLASSVPAGPFVRSAELAGEAELLHIPATLGLASPDSELSDGSAQVGMPAEAQAELVMAQSRDAEEQAFSPDQDSQQGAGPPDGAKNDQKLRRTGSKGQAKRMRDDGDDDSLAKPAKHRRPVPSRAGPHDRSPSSGAEEYHTDSGSYERNRSQEPSTAKTRSPQAKHGSKDSQKPASRSRSACGQDGQWPFKRGRVIPCSTKMSVEMLGNLKFGSDHKEDLEDLDPDTAVFLWNYEKQKMHGIFAGTWKPVKDTPKHASYLYEVRVKNYAEYRSLPKEVALRLVPRDGKTSRGETLLQPHLDADHVDRLCSAFAK